MIYRLEKNDYHRVCDLYRGLDFHLCALAVLEGRNPGRVWVDDPAAPQTSFMVSPEGCYLAGKPDHLAFNRALNQALLSGEILGAIPVLVLILASEAWVSALDTICASLSPIPIARRHYVYPALRPGDTSGGRRRGDAQGEALALPEGFAVQRIDEAFLSRPGLKIPEHITGWIANNWGSTADYLRDGFGFATVYRDEIVSWSLADCICQAGCEIGIQTEPEYRQRGLAAITAGAAVGYALSKGLPLVGWQCSEDNLGSWKTAEKVGFELERRYTLYYTVLRETAHS